MGFYDLFVSIFVFQALTVAQIRPIVKSIDAAIAQNNDDRIRTEEERGESIREIGNMLHETCIISNDEVTKGLSIHFHFVLDIKR